MEEPIDITQGLFVVIDGIDGSGKSSQVQLVSDALIERGFPIYRTAEPSGSEYGQLMRKRLQEKHDKKSKAKELDKPDDKLFDPQIDALLFTLDRYEHVRKEIIPMLNAGKIVISDRYYYSTIAYQTAQGLDKKWVYSLQKYLIRPNLYFFFDIDPNISLSRIADRGVKEKFEKEAFLKKVQKNFESTIDYDPDQTHVVRVDATKPIEEVTELIITELQPFLEQWRKKDLGSLN